MKEDSNNKKRDFWTLIKQYQLKKVPIPLFEEMKKKQKHQKKWVNKKKVRKSKIEKATRKKISNTPKNKNRSQS